MREGGSLSFAVLGPPQPKGRPRLGKGGHTFTPPKTRRAERDFVLQSKRHAPDRPLSGPIEVELVFIMPIPKRVSKAAAAGMLGDPHVKVPDLDNLTKLAMDSMNGLFYADDSTVFSLTAKKFYGRLPRTEVTIRWKRGDAPNE